MSKKIRTEAVDYLFQGILSLKDKEECYTFFEDICTINELLSLSQRFEVAKMLREHKTYLEIAEKTGASTATISRTALFLFFIVLFLRIVIFRSKKIWKIIQYFFYNLLLNIDIETQVADKCK